MVYTKILVLAIVACTYTHAELRKTLPEKDTLPDPEDKDKLRFVFILIRETTLVPELKEVVETKPKDDILLDGANSARRRNKTPAQVEGASALTGEDLMKFLGRSVRSRYLELLIDKGKKNEGKVSFLKPLTKRGTCDDMLKSVQIFQKEFFKEISPLKMSSDDFHEPCIDYNLEQCGRYQELMKQIMDNELDSSYAVVNKKLYSPDQLKESYDKFIIEHYKNAMLKQESKTVEDLQRVATEYMHRVTSGFQNLEAFTLGPMYDEVFNEFRKNRLWSGTFKVHVRVVDDLTASAFLSRLSNQEQVARLGDVILLEGRVREFFSLFVKAYHYSALDASEARFRLITEVNRPDDCLCCDSLFRQNYSECRLDFFQCEHMPYSTVELGKACNSSAYQTGAYSWRLDRPVTDCGQLRRRELIRRHIIEVPDSFDNMMD